MNDKYNSFLIAALLHDIGKFIQRSDNNNFEKKTRSSYSGIFIEKFRHTNAYLLL